MTHLEVAKSQLGVQESKERRNWGPEVSQYLKSVGLDFPASWCMAFVYWCCKQANPSTPLVRTGGVLKQWNKIPKKYKFKGPKQGDIFIMDFGGGLGHAGIVENVVENMIHTIEGNSNDEGSRDGHEVCRRYRPISKCKGFIRI